ncbi:hypothetical protein [Halovivax cerinus]|uniref:Uncharacterized protein n=1 Tax=Halovivax cerinus TaxID=1487865 RepID=A0ABD5NT63_9EURY|nr:hypothetical protein [Halovivax cerinus]
MSVRAPVRVRIGVTVSQALEVALGDRIRLFLEFLSVDRTPVTSVFRDGSAAVFAAEL